MLTEISPSLHVQWSLFLSKFSQDCNTHTCGQASVGQNFRSIKIDKYECGGSSVFVCGQKKSGENSRCFLRSGFEIPEDYYYLEFNRNSTEI